MTLMRQVGLVVVMAQLVSAARNTGFYSSSPFPVIIWLNYDTDETGGPSGGHGTAGKYSEEYRILFILTFSCHYMAKL